MKKVTYIISNIDKALAFEWIAEKTKKSVIELSFILIVQKPAILENFLKEHKVPVHTFYYSSKKDLPLVFWKLYRVLKALKPDIVHCHLFYASVIGLTAAWLAGIKNRIYTRHHSDLHHRYFPAGIKWDKWCHARSTKIVAPSNAVKELLVKHEDVCADKVTVIHHGFDLDYFRNVSPKLISEMSGKYNASDQYPVIGVISRFTEWKGVQYIIPAFRKLLDLYPHALLLLFNAKGDYEDEIKKALKSIPEKNYRLIIFENQLSACYPIFDLFVHTPIDTHVEAFGQVYVEALAANIPSVFTLSGIAPDFIKDGKNALVVPFEDSHAIYAAIVKILRNPHLREHLTEEGWESVKERFALQLMIDKLEELYHAE